MKRALIVAATGGFLNGFLIPDMKLLQEMGYEVHCAANGNSVSTFVPEERFASIGVTFHQIDFSSTSPVSKESLTAYKQYKELLNRYHFDFVHVHTPIPGAIVRIATRRKRKEGCVVVYTTHGLTFPKGSSLKTKIVYNEFEKLDVNYDYERNYYEKADRVVTISQDCVDSFARVYPDLRKKTLVLENISSPETIRNAAKLVPEDDFFQYKGLKIVSIGRLAPQKGYEIAIDAAAKVKKQGIEFVWYILGEGELRAELEGLIKTNELVKEVKLVGIKENPYPYIAGCDIFAQTSRYEGKSIALDEAKILNKPILVTNYATVGASINNGENGLIVSMNGESVAEGLMQLSENQQLRNQLVENLKKEKTGNEEEINKYIQLIEENLN